MLARSSLVALAFALFVLVVPVRCLAADGVASVTLPNGLRVIIIPSHTVAIIAIDIWVRAGTRRQPIDQQGVAHFLEHLLFKGTPARPSESQIDGAIEDLGGSVDAATSYDWAHFYTIVPSAGFATALDVLGDALQHATIAPAAVESERAVILSEIARRDDSAQEQLLQRAHELVYPANHPYHYAIMGTPVDVESISRQEILDFYHAWYVPNNVTLVVAGDVTPQAVQAAAEREFGSWEFSPGLLEDEGFAVLPPASHRQIVHRDAGQTYLMMAFLAPSVQDKPDVWQMDVLMTLLGQGSAGRLDAQLHRRRHLVTSIDAEFLTQRDAGLLTISATLPTGNLDAAEAAILDQIRTLRAAPVSDDELARAKQALLASYLFDEETDSGHADSIGFYDSIDSFDYDNGYVAHFEATTSDDLLRIARKYLTPNTYTFVALVPPTDAINAQRPRPVRQLALLERR